MGTSRTHSKDVAAVAASISQYLPADAPIATIASRAFFAAAALIHRKHRAESEHPTAAKMMADHYRQANLDNILIHRCGFYKVQKVKNAICEHIVRADDLDAFLANAFRLRYGLDVNDLAEMEEQRADREWMKESKLAQEVAAIRAIREEEGAA